MDTELACEVKLFPQNKGWHYVDIPLSISTPLLPLANRGLIAIEACVGSTRWLTSLLPHGNGRHFIPLPAKVRAQNNIKIADIISIRFCLRK